jgi:hypothetical protein
MCCHCHWPCALRYVLDHQIGWRHQITQVCISRSANIAYAENPGNLIFRMLFTFVRLAVLLLYGRIAQFSCPPTCGRLYKVARARGINSVLTGRRQTSCCQQAVLLF